MKLFTVINKHGIFAPQTFQELKNAAEFVVTRPSTQSYIIFEYDNRTDSTKVHKIGRYATAQNIIDLVMIN